jgi:hypothetical protein
MAFTVQVADPVTEYILSRQGLTTSDHERIFAGLEQELSEHAETFLNRNPHPYLPDRFWYDFWLMTDAHEVRAFRFACSAEGRVYGVIGVLYAEEWPEDVG